MSLSIKIEISDAPTAEIAHRFRNLGEDIHRAVQGCDIRMEEIDAATTSFVVRGIERRNLGSATAAIKKQLIRHGFDKSAALVRL